MNLYAKLKQFSFTPALNLHSKGEKKRKDLSASKREIIFRCHLSSTFVELAESEEGSINLQKKPKLLPMIFIITADIAGGNATNPEVKCEVAKTTPNDEFCIPTCKGIGKF